MKFPAAWVPQAVLPLLRANVPPPRWQNSPGAGWRSLPRPPVRSKELQPLWQLSKSLFPCRELLAEKQGPRNFRAAPISAFLPKCFTKSHRNYLHFILWTFCGILMSHEKRSRSVFINISEREIEKKWKWMNPQSTLHVNIVHQWSPTPGIGLWAIFYLSGKRRACWFEPVTFLLWGNNRCSTAS